MQRKWMQRVADLNKELLLILSIIAGAGVVEQEKLPRSVSKCSDECRLEIAGTRRSSERKAARKLRRGRGRRRREDVGVEVTGGPVGSR